MVSRLNKVFGKGFEVWNHNCKVFGYGWIIGFGKLKKKKKDDEISRGYRMIGTYFSTQGIHQEIRSHELVTQGNPPQRLKNKRYTSSPK